MENGIEKVFDDSHIRVSNRSQLGTLLSPFQVLFTGPELLLKQPGKFQSAPGLLHLPFPLAEGSSARQLQESLLTSSSFYSERCLSP